MDDVLTMEIPRSRSEQARQVLERISWRGYMPPEAGQATEVLWEVPADQIDLIRAVLRRNRRLAGSSPTNWGSIDRVCETIAEASRRLGVRPNYGYETGFPPA
ncbi:hypothetical protein CLV78_102241 [Aliiruegeria haliotis]|uniref:Uncharacterized protein n=1 Tax=Aliiruegeria haliotis TaxID=1280846 RepID=A0A2T0RV75_9RHOB|nr:hypothetical protein [Aliiruegeria haliotis]PRY25064.1 hypothetical protein CLV78_102241 [Aliiruegeria haliotis]